MSSSLFVLFLVCGLAASQKVTDSKILPVEPIKPILRNCCRYNGKTMVLDLHKGTLLNNNYTTPGVTNVNIEPNANPKYREMKCSHMADMKVTFQGLPRCWNNWNQCMDRPVCGRRMLKVEMEIHQVHQGWLFNIGDSQSNDGWGGDGSHQTNDAEIMGLNQNTLAFQSDQCSSNSMNLGATLTNAKSVTFYIGNEFTRVVTKDAMGAVLVDNRFCYKCLFALNGQPDTTVNYDIYVALNRVIRGAHRNGYGVCRATISWECCQL